MYRHNIFFCFYFIVFTIYLTTAPKYKEDLHPFVYNTSYPEHLKGKDLGISISKFAQEIYMVGNKALSIEISYKN